ncbi:zinc protease [Breoghania corrubedonensis]|uniref:Zinc protease n=1 Tax=Breoghania corrubedonensis TaxID=665038 RepID=A0A2T5VEX4_9HYPH|nr:pitrilysin family protein [Breoghania corrubedonensis]PTW62304.1 zinc protease [Breoghania corrubedonensis]
MSLTKSRFMQAACAAALAFTIVAGPVPSLAETAKPSAASDFADVKIGADVSTFTLDNGLQVVVIPDHRAPVVTQMIWYKVGAADESPGKSGIAHFLEHLMFKGTKTHPQGEFSAVVSELGGSENAFTSSDYTAYFQRVAKQHLKTVMSFEADRMENLVLSDAVVAPERKVILEERSMRVDNDPGSRLSEAVNSVLYANNSGYAIPIIGWRAEMEKLSAKDAIAFYNRFYTPNNAVLVIAGDVDEAQVKTLAEETYGKVARRADPPARLRPAEPPLPGHRIVRLSDPRVKQPSVRDAWIVPSYTTAKNGEAEALDVLADVLGGGATSRLYRQLVVTDKIATSAGSYYSSTQLGPTDFTVYAVPRDGVSLDDVRAASTKVIADIARNGITDEELARAKRKVLANAIYAQDSQSTLARIFGSTLTTGGTIKDVQEWPARISRVTADQVKAAAAYLDANRSVTAYLTGKPIEDGNKS